MKRKFEVPKSKLYAGTDYSQVLKTGAFAGFDLIYNELNPIAIPSGAICFFDVYSPTASVKPFMQSFPTGQAAPFYLSVNTSAGERIAYAGLRFSGETPVRWRLALYEERDVIKLTADSSYPVSAVSHSGFLGFSDYITQREYIDFVRRSPSEEHPLDTVVQFDGNTATLFGVSETAALAIFSSGWGDGEYPSYIGTNQNGDPIAIICDFLMIDSDKKEKISGIEQYEFDIEIEQLYQNDPSLSPDENNVAKWSFVISYASEVDELTLYRAYARRGYAYHSLRDLNAALSDYYVAIRLAEKLESGGTHKIREWTLYDNAGVINREQGNLNEAKRLFEKGKAVGDSFYSGVYARLIEIYMSEKDYDSAEATAAEMLRARPSDPFSYSKSAEVCVAASKYEKAIGYYDILIERFHWDEAIMEKTACLGLLGRYECALSTLETFLSENAPNEVYYHNKAFLQYKQNRFEDAMENLLYAYNINPQFAPTLHLLIEMGDLMFDYENVLNWSTQYITIRPDSEYGYIVRADAYAKLGKYSLARDEYERIFSKFSDDVLYVHRYIAMCLQAGDINRAQKRIKKYRTDNPDFYRHVQGMIFAYKGNLVKAELFFQNAGFVNEDALCDRLDFFIRTRNEPRANELLQQLNRLAPFSENTILRKFHYAKTFGDELEIAAVLTEYLKDRLPNLSESESGQIRKRLARSAEYI